jgi:hypothetical protein
MPNHCTNQLYCEDGDFNSIIEQFKSIDHTGETFLDFEKIIPIPDDLRIESSPGTKDKELKKKYKSNSKKHGFETWYDFCVNQWGTKWNSYDCTFNDAGMCFLTAWSPPQGIIKELAKRTGKTFVLEYIEEGCDFCGRYIAGPETILDEAYSPISDAPESLKESLGYQPWEEEDE